MARLWFALMITIAFVVPPAVAETTWSLEEALERSDLVYTETGDGAFVVVFKPQQTRAVDYWPVTLRSVADDEWILVYCSVLEAHPERSFPESLLKKALEYNGKAAGSKFAIDPETGDLDVQYELPVAALSPGVIRDVVRDVAATCDANRDLFEDLVRADR